MDPLVSVLLPVYNGEATVREAIESVLDQDYPNFEFIILNNASTDNTAAIISEYSSDQRLQVIRNQETLPRLENFVRVFAAASDQSRWLKFIGDDDRLLPGCLSAMVQAGEQSEKVGLVTSHYYDGGLLVKGALPPGQELVSGPQFLRRLLLEPGARSTIFSPASLMIAHRVYRELGFFRTDLLHADSELFYRILNHYDLAYVHKPLTVTGYHSGSGQAGSTADGFTFAEAYLIRYEHLKYYSNLQFSARGEFRKVFGHLRKIPAPAIYHLPLSLVYFLALAVKKLLRGEKIKIFQR